MVYSVHLKKSAENELDRLPSKIHGRIIKVMLSLEKEPFPRGVKKLHGREGYRLRVGVYRILYMVDHGMKQIIVYSIAHRREVYRS